MALAIARLWIPATSGPLLALVGSATAALAIALEPRTIVRLAFELSLVVGYLAAAFHDDVGWHFDEFHAGYAVWTAAEAVLVMVFLETGLWRWSVFAGFPMVAALFYHLFPSYSGDIVDVRIAWLVQALALLIATGGVRAIRDDR